MQQLSCISFAKDLHLGNVKLTHYPICNHLSTYNYNYLIKNLKYFVILIKN